MNDSRSPERFKDLPLWRQREILDAYENNAPSSRWAEYVLVGCVAALVIVLVACVVW